MDQAVKVRIYSTPWCVFCKMAKDYLKSRKVKFEEIDVETDTTAAQALVDRTGQMGVPVIEIGEETILGFDRPRIDSALRDKKLI